MQSSLKTLVLSKNDIDIIRMWAGNTIQGGHWGDGAMLTPMDEMAYHELDRFTPGDKGGFSKTTIDTILIWSDHNTGGPEEMQLIDKLSKFE